MSKHKSKKKLLKTVSIVVAVLVVAVGVGVLVRWLLTNQPAGDQAKDERPVVEQVQDFRLGGDFAEAAKKIDEALNNAETSADDRYMLYIQQGSSFEDQQDLVKAAESYQKAAAIKETYEVTRLLADTYRYIGDKEMAITYYKKSLPLIRQENNPYSDEDKEIIEQLIRDLGGQV